MKGIVLDFSLQQSSGVISGSDGKRYKFASANWKQDRHPFQGMKVDFDINEEGEAVEIYPDLEGRGSFSGASANFSNDVVQKITEFSQSSLGQRLSALLTHGLHNRFGLIVSIMTLLSLFFPIIETALSGEYRIIDSGSGKLLFVLLILLAILFYGGSTRLYVKILTGVILGIIFVDHYDSLSKLNSINRTFGFSHRNSPSSFSWGLWINIVACITLLFASFIGGYTSNKDAV